MTQQTNLYYIRKALQMDLIKAQIQLQISKSELNGLIAEAMSNPDSAASIKRILNPLLANSFPQFPTFTQITLADTDESGATTVILREPRQVADKPATPVQSMEPPVVTPTVTPDYVDNSTNSTDSDE